MSWHSTVSSVLLCCSCLSWLTVQSARGADFSSWRWKSSIRFGGYVGTESLTGFPAEVCIAEDTITGFRYNRFRSGGWKELRFTASDQATELNYEVEEWNTNGVSIVWVQVPRLASSNDYIWAFWGKSGQAAPPYTTNGMVWSNHYVGVWHLSENPTNPAPQMIDSTTNRHHGTAVNMTSADRVAGRAGPALYFDGTDSRVTGGDLGFDPPRYTIEFWAHRKGSSSNWRVILGLASANAVHMWVYDNGTIGWGDVDSPWEGQDAGWTDKLGFHHVAMAVDTAINSQLYFDGASRATYSIAPPDAWNSLAIGGDGYLFRGILDEVRLSDVQRSADWIRAAYLNVASNSRFIVNTRAIGPPLVANDGGACNVGTFSADLRAYVTATGGVPTQLRIYCGTADGGTNPASWGRTNIVGPVSLGAYTTAVPVVANTVYAYRSCVSNSYGVEWADSTAWFFTGAVTVSPSDSTASELTLDQGTFTVSRPSNATGFPATVNYAIGGTASAGQDYAALPGMVVIPAGATNGTIVVQPINDYLDESDETVALTLSQGNYLIGAPSNAIVTIAGGGETNRFPQWQQKLSIRFAGYDGTNTLTNIPLLVSFSEGTITGFDYSSFLSGQNSDLRFSDSNSFMELNYEVDTWNTAGVSRVWVQMPRLATNTDSIRAYWGRKATAQPQYTTNGATWSESFAGVWHMTENPTNAAPQVRDSTANGHHGTTYNMGPAALVAGKVGYALDFDGINDQVRGGNLNTNPAEYTIEVTARRSTVSTFQRFICLANNGAVNMWLYDSGTIGWGDTDNPWEGRASGWTDKTYFHHLAMAVDTYADARLYMDGLYAATYTITAPEEWDGLVIGGEGGGTFFDGEIDEVRLSSVKRSADWIRTTWRNVVSNSSFVQFGEVLGPPLVSNGGGATNVTAGDADLRASVISTGGVPTQAWIYWGTSDGGTNAGSWGHTNSLGTRRTGTYTSAVSTVSDTAYVYRTRGVNARGSHWADPAATFITGEITAAPPDPSASERGPDTGLFTVSRPLSTTQFPVRISFSIGGSADEGTDYQSLPRSVLIPAGSASASVTVTPVDDSDDESTETVVLTLGAGPYRIAAPGTATVNLEGREARVFTDWREKVRISLKGYTGSETLTNFPVLVAFSEAGIQGFSYENFLSPPHYDLRFSDANEFEALPYEVDTWNTGGVSLVWVRVPRIDSTNASIWAFWGRGGALPPDYALDGAAWSNRYAGVWHMSQSPTSAAPQILDSAPAPHHCTAENMTGANWETGRLGRAISFDGVNDRLTGGNLGQDPVYYTVEVWAKRVGIVPSYHIFLGLAAANAAHMWVYENGTIGWGDSDSSWEGRASGWTNKTDYHYIAMGVNTEVGSDLYFDGSYCASYGITAQEPWNYLTLGMDGGPSFVGAIDEVRLSTVKRSASWIRNCWSNAVSPDYCEYGKVLPAGGYGTILFIQ